MYPFKKGHTYTVVMMAEGTAPIGQVGPTLYASILSAVPDPQQTQPAACGPVSHDSWSAVQSAYAFNTSGTALNTYSFPSITTTADLNVLTILAVGNRENVPDTVKIHRLSIVDEVKLGVAPTSVSRACGDATPQNFRVDNPSGVSVTSYQWDLGSADNGWLYNGSPAPQIITTPPAVNVITLTPSCNKTISSVKVSALIDGKTYPAGTIAASSPTPSYSMIGPSSVCTSGSFSISNLPCNASVDWMVSPDGIVNLTQSNNSASLTKIFDDQFTIYATISGGCLTAPVTVSQTMTAGTGVEAYYTAGPDGPYTPTPFPTSPVPNFSSSYYITYFAHLNPSGLSNVHWSWSYEAPYSFNGWNDGFTMTNMRNGSLVYVILDADGSCGHIHKEYPFLSLISGTIPGGFAMNVWPNPAAGSVNVSTSVKSGTSSVAADFTKAKIAKVKTEEPSPYKVYAVKITDVTGKIVKQVQYKEGVTSLNVPLGGIRSGYYLLSAYDGRQWTSKSILINE